MKKHHHGFTLLELLVVIAIIGILATLAVPSYKHYMEKARFAEVVMATVPYKNAIALAIQEGTPREDISTETHGVPGAPSATKNLASLSVKQGVIAAIGTKAAGGYTYILTPNEDGSRWSISGTCRTAGACKS